MRELVAAALWIAIGVVGFAAIYFGEQIGVATLAAAGALLILASALLAIWTSYRTSMLDRDEARG